MTGVSPKTQIRKASTECRGFLLLVQLLLILRIAFQHIQRQQIDSPFPTDYHSSAGLHCQPVLTDRSSSASEFAFLSITLMCKNLLVPLCGRTGGGRVRACWF